MNKAKIFLKKPIQFKDKFKIYPPSVNDVFDNEFDKFRGILLITQEELDREYSNCEELSEFGIPTPFQFLLIQCYNDSEYEQLAKQAFKFFTHEEVSFLLEAESILIGNLEESLGKVEITEDSLIEEQLNLLKEEDYFEFQNAVRQCVGMDIEDTPEDLNILHPRIREMKLKARERDRIKAKQLQKTAPTLETSLAAICCMGSGLNPLNIGEISYACISKLIEMNQRREKYDSDKLSIMLGADPKKVKIEYWIGENNED